MVKPHVKTTVLCFHIVEKVHIGGFSFQMPFQYFQLGKRLFLEFTGAQLSYVFLIDSWGSVAVIYLP